MRIFFSLLLSLLLHLGVGAFFLLIPIQGSQPTAGGGGVEVILTAAPEPQEKGETKSESGTHTQQEGHTFVGKGIGQGDFLGDGSGSEGTDPLLAEIRKKIERSKYYPHLAQKVGLTGSASVSFSIDQKGQPTGILIDRSSGEPILDEAAKTTLLRAAPFPSYPNRLKVLLTFKKE